MAVHLQELLCLVPQQHSTINYSIMAWKDILLVEQAEEDLVVMNQKLNSKLLKILMRSSYLSKIEVY